jgi:hypothetical protein
METESVISLGTRSDGSQWRGISLAQCMATGDLLLIDRQIECVLHFILQLAESTEDSLATSEDSDIGGKLNGVWEQR